MLDSLSGELGLRFSIVSEDPDSLSCIPGSKAQDFTFKRTTLTSRIYSGFPRMEREGVKGNLFGKEIRQPAKAALCVLRKRFTERKETVIIQNTNYEERSRGIKRTDN